MAIVRTPQEVATEVDPETAEGQAVIGQLVERAKTMSAAVRYLWPIPRSRAEPEALPAADADLDRLGRG